MVLGVDILLHSVSYQYDLSLRFLTCKKSIYWKAQICVVRWIAPLKCYSQHSVLVLNRQSSRKLLLGLGEVQLEIYKTVCVPNSYVSPDI